MDPCTVPNSTTTNSRTLVTLSLWQGGQTVKLCG